MLLHHPPRDGGGADRQAAGVERAQQTGRRAIVPPGRASSRGRRGRGPSRASSRTPSRRPGSGRSAGRRGPARSHRTRPSRSGRPRTARGGARRGSARRDRRRPPRRQQREHEVARRPRPGGGQRSTAATIIATPPFMSSAPRPQMKPSATTPSNGGCVHPGRPSSRRRRALGGAAAAPPVARSRATRFGRRLGRHDPRLEAARRAGRPRATRCTRARRPAGSSCRSAAAATAARRGCRTRPRLHLRAPAPGAPEIGPDPVARRALQVAEGCAVPRPAQPAACDLPTPLGARPRSTASEGPARRGRAPARHALELVCCAWTSRRLTPPGMGAGAAGRAHRALRRRSVHRPRDVRAHRARRRGTPPPPPAGERAAHLRELAPHGPRPHRDRLGS